MDAVLPQPTDLLINSWTLKSKYSLCEYSHVAEVFALSGEDEEEKAPQTVSRLQLAGALLKEE